MREEALNCQVEFAPSRLFLEGKKDWLEEELLVLAKKKRGRIIGEGSSTTQEGGTQQNMCHHLEEFPRCQVTTVVYQCKLGEWCSHTPTKFCSTQRSLCGHMHTFLNHNIMWPPLEDTL
jgi:hypothetical protein